MNFSNSSRLFKAYKETKTNLKYIVIEFKF